MDTLRERIIKESTKMFAEYGIKSVRMDDIASRCGISKRTLYEIFSGREELITASMEHFVRKFEAIIEEGLKTTGNVMDEFWIIVGYGSAFRNTNISLIKDLVKFYPKVFDGFMKNHHVEMIEKNRERIERGQRDGLILKNISSEFMARNLSNYLYGINRNWENMQYVSGDTNVPDQLFEFTVMLYLRGIATEKGRKYIDEKILAGLE